MRDFVVMCDVNGDVLPQYAEQEDIKIFPQYYHFNDGIIYGDEIKLDAETFFARIKGGERAYSMGCNPERVRGIMEEALKAEHDIIIIMASSQCSGSYNTVCAEAAELLEDYPEARIHVVDSYLESTPLGFLAYFAQEMKKQGKSFDEVTDFLEKKKDHMNCFFIVDDLSCLVRGGRLSAIGGAVGTMLNIKPILCERDGLIAAFAKARGKKAAKQMIIEELKKMDLDLSIGAVVDAVAYEECEQFGEEITEKTGMQILWHTQLNPTIGAHTGPGAIGVVYCTKDR